MKRTLIWVTLFSIAMGFLETSVVVYLRYIFYPEGFTFPLVPLDQELAVTEFWREVATMIMLVGIGVLAGKSTAQRFGWFIYSFAVWDIFYYVFLYVLLGWPDSLMTWDILFLIPMPWVGPVITPIIITAIMIMFSQMIIRYDLMGRKAHLNLKEWAFAITGSLVVIISWTLDYCQYVLASGESVWTLSSNSPLFTGAEAYVPQDFSWSIFWCGIAFYLIGLYLYYRRVSR